MDLKEFTDKVAAIDEEYYLSKEKTIIAKLGELEFVPIEIPEFRWNIKNNDGYGYLKLDGSLEKLQVILTLTFSVRKEGLAVSWMGFWSV